ncbi:filamentous hemagglutinin N-terminal domain-containing protein [Pleurocapsa sp. PCC 7319]|uniref:two-partner secretion domain-containing protein n=1 Tax=Pleurocapsa sp. PCC 7319 TaxID=118161 RepID=UPI00034A280E|nr:filamentous hemagglutinin N-terminal domain-containing protein [Pleurocapsa sp. PCC 7319]
MKLKQTRLFYKQQLVRVGQGLCLSSLMFFAPITSVKAQITPDGSLPTSVEQQGDNELNINGGEREGNNLFHSFEEFSVPEGIEAVFENAPDIENIFTRITGDTASSIDGILRTQGGANFFLVNPNGIVFGENASLDVGGSFIGTTANSIQFEDGVEFTTNDGEEQPILTVSVPIGLQFDGNSGAITVNGTGNQINSESPVGSIEFNQRPSGLSAPSNQTFALVGNGVNLNGGVISTIENGQIYLNSINSGLVDINQSEAGLTLTSDNVTEYQDINLNQQSLVDTSGDLIGSIFLTGKNINILNQSFVLSQNQGNLSDASLNIQASELLTVSGRSQESDVRSSIRSENFNSGEGADVNIFADRVTFQNGARIRTNSFSEATGGNINVNATNSISFSAPSSLIATTFAEGNAGDINLLTSGLLVDASGISSSTNGAGNGGTLEINADLVEIIGTSSTDRASISSTSFADGNAGNLILSTDKLRVIDGASLSSSSFANGNAGNINVDASELVEVKGTASNPRQIQTSNPQSTIRAAVQSVPPAAQRALGLPSMPGGDGGNVTINTTLFDIAQEGVVTVENQGTGNGGTLSVDAEQINLAEAGRITAATESGLGGEINIKTDNLQIDSGSDIAATAENNGDGGNIIIKTNTLIAKKNSEVTANAFQGRGGNLNIDAEGLFLFDSPENIFSASSELGIDGTIQINTPDINLQRELEQSELEFFNAEQAIANSCLARSSGQVSFNIGGSDEFPKNPNSNYSDANFSLTGVGSLPTTDKQSPSTQADNSQYNQSTIPAEKMVETGDGRILLVAAPQKAESIYCHSAKEK